MLVEQVEARAFEQRALLAIGLVRHCDPEHPVRDLLASEIDLELGFDPGDLLGVLAGQRSEETLAREAPELGRRALEPPGRLELRQVLVAPVDLLELERLLVAGEVQVVLLVELGDEAVGVVPERVELAARQGVGRHRASSIGARCTRSASRASARRS